MFYRISVFSTIWPFTVASLLPNLPRSFSVTTIRWRNLNLNLNLKFPQLIFSGDLLLIKNFFPFSWSSMWHGPLFNNQHKSFTLAVSMVYFRWTVKIENQVVLKKLLLENGFKLLLSGNNNFPALWDEISQVHKRPLSFPVYYSLLNRKSIHKILRWSHPHLAIFMICT